ncbi:MAG: MinD/ParA family protein [Alphaproteobacteria bacterium]
MKNVIAVASGKGGVGKTWFSITLSHTLANNNKKVLLFDADLGLANVDIQLGLMAPHDLGEVVAGRITLNQAIATFDAGNFDVLVGRSGSGGLANIPIGRLQMLWDDLMIVAKSYDKTILDLGAGVEKNVRLFSKNAGSIIVICTDEPTSLTDAYAFIKVSVMDNPKANIKIVINAANSVREGQRTYETLLKACNSFLKISPPLLGIIRRDTKVRDAIRNQKSIITRYPNTEAAEDVDKIAKLILQDEN